jgi:hypothetical protein
MSAAEYSKLTTDELLNKFVETAKRAGTIFTWDKAIVSNPQFKALAPEMQALGAELRKRNPREKLRGLFEHADPHVRGWAGPQFLSVDPDWATATITGLFHNLSTREVLAWRDRILRGAPRRQVLEEMSGPQLVDCFIDACERCYGATRFLTDEQGGGPSMKAYNEVSGEPYAIAKELNARGELRALVPLLDHPCVTVREKAGMFCLDIAADKATAVLEALGGVDSRHEAAEGSTMLSLWRMGKFKPLSK